MKTSVNIVLAMLLMVATAFAATITHTTAIFPSPTNWSLTNSVPQFDPVLGTLTNVSVAVGSNVRNRVRVESRSNLPRSATAGGIGTVTTSVGGIAIQAGVTNSHTQTLGAFDGVIDYAGASGFDVTLDGSAFADGSATDLTPFIGTGNTLMTVNAAANGTYNGPGDYRFVISTTASALVTVTYEFSPPVCPSCDPEPECAPEPECDDRRKPRNRRR